MATSQPYVVQADTSVTWGGETTFVRHGTIVDAVAGSPLYAAYGGDANLKPLGPSGDPSVADHSDLGD